MTLMVEAMKVKVGNPLRKLVLIKLADQANDAGECWPSYQTIAKACEISRRTAVSHIEWLEENGFLEVEKRYCSKSKKSQTNVYHLTIKKGQIDGENPALPSANAALGSETDAPPSANAAPSSGANAAPKPVNKPINESINERESAHETKKPKKRAHQLPEDWQPSKELIAWAKAENISIDVIAHSERFKDYWIGGGQRKADWDATWRNWMRREQDYQADRKPKKPSPHDLSGQKWGKNPTLDELPF